MAKLHTLSFPSTCPTLLIPPNFCCNSSKFLPFSISYRKPNSFRVISCLSSSSSGSILTVETLSSEIQQQVAVVDDEVSTTRLLAQNVPWSSTADDIRLLFQQFGTVVDVELSMHNKTRNRGLAFVEMGSAEDASEAFAKLESFEYEGRNLKLTYAKPKKKKVAPLPPTKPPVVYNLFVANLPFEARAKDLKAFFQSGGSDPVSAEIIFQDTPRKSSGYGFVSFKTKKEADDVLLAFDGKELLGRPIRVARSRRFVKLESELKSQAEEEEDSSTHSSQGSDQPEASEM